MSSNLIPTWFHPASGLLILALDWLLFSGGVLTLGISTPLLLILAALLAAGGVTGLQRRYGNDGRRASLLKGLVGGIAVGLPLPIAGTGVGGLVLALSGLNRLRKGDRGSDSSPLPNDPPASEE
jgi:hypothetical protein